MTNPIRNETSLVLVVAVIFSAVAIPVLSGFLEPSQPPAVAAVQIGDPRDGNGGAGTRDDGAPASPPEPRERPPADDVERPPADDVQGARADDVQRRRPAPQPAAPARPRQTAPPAPADDAAEDDGGEAD